jgi:adenine-specific DNA methylase
VVILVMREEKNVNIEEQTSLDIMSKQLISSSLEDPNFPFEKVSDVAELESWRKEINRPIYHIHKWWAQRLGTVFRVITFAALSPLGTDIFKAIYQPINANRELIIFDPFMGSGTTIGEAAKLGTRVIGKDINPVAYFLVKNALSIHNHGKILLEFKSISTDVASKIKVFYKTTLPNGQEADVLYYFWVMTANCPCCNKEVDLFSTRIFARNAYPKRFPEAQAVCPICGGINQIRYDDNSVSCASCKTIFNPQLGSVSGQKVSCSACNHTFSIVTAIRAGGAPPKFRLYAKMVLLPDGSKIYEATDENDRQLYEKASALLADRHNAFPVELINPGYNTDQVLNYNYKYWHEMFNDRQLLCLSILAERIKKIQDPILRDLFTCLFSGTLEFNNMFASYKGEGTGAVRHMFAHHILKPERTPLEANLWGTPKSSGSFMTMFKGRICRALEYASNPFEIQIEKNSKNKASKKIFGLSKPLGFELANNYSDFAAGKYIYLSCGDSSCTDIPDNIVDAIITDPPFFDNVHYSQLADFFYVWQRHILGENGLQKNNSTRSNLEVQNSDVSLFTERLTAVWKEAHRVLKNDGILAFTYHHSRPEGWYSILQTIMNSGFIVTAAQPIKAEMSFAMPKRLAKEPIDLDIILVCRKRPALSILDLNKDLWEIVKPKINNQVMRFQDNDRFLSRNDLRIIIMAQFLLPLSIYYDTNNAVKFLKSINLEIDKFIEELYAIQ